jgi:hypothetical protein
MKLMNKDGIEMMDVASLQRVGDVLVVKGKIMRSMPATIHLRPEDLWQAFSLFSWPLLLSLPWLMLKGLMRSRQARRQTDT